MRGLPLRRPSFTLIELLLVIGIMGALSAIVITAVAPKRQLSAATDSGRRIGAKALQNAIVQYMIDEGHLPDETIPSDGSQRSVCKQGITGNGTCVNLHNLVPKYLPSIPQDPMEPCSALLSGFEAANVENRIQVSAKWLGVLQENISRSCESFDSCGDGVITGDETCDSGILNSDATPTVCRSDCTRCGDSHIDASSESCDPPGGSCSATCQLPGTMIAGASGNWSNSSNWVGGSLPGAGATCEIPAGSNITLDVSASQCASFTIAAGATLTVNSGVNLSVPTVTNNGILNVQGTLTNIGSFTNNGVTSIGGTLTYDNAFQYSTRTVTNHGSLTLLAGGRFFSKAENAFVNDGQIDVSHGTVTYHAMNTGTATPLVLGNLYQNLIVSYGATVVLQNDLTVTGTIAQIDNGNINANLHTVTAGNITSTWFYNNLCTTNAQCVSPYTCQGSPLRCKQCDTSAECLVLGKTTCSGITHRCD